ncbi:hypothetical protein V5F77_12875 [Xanthobacter sp. DSM 24535]|uniref:hypothetical protein n=1 Tax=Roseixanthobacter psychrophilus TaxID=3119917 RepID=UPI00372B59EA
MSAAGKLLFGLPAGAKFMGAGGRLHRGWGVLAVPAALGFALTPDCACAGAWTLRESQVQAYLQSTATRADHAFDGSSNLYAAQTYDKISTQLFMEVGANDVLTLIVAPELLSISLGSPADTSYLGAGYTDLGGRVKIAEGDGFVASLQAVARFPGAKPGEGPAVIGYVNGELDLRALAGWNFVLWGWAAFLDVEVAQRLRFGAPPDEVRLDVTLGVRLAPRWLALAQSFNVVSEGAGEAPYFDASYEYYKLQMGVMYDLADNFSVQASLVTTYFARNALQENGLVLAALYRY